MLYFLTWYLTLTLFGLAALPLGWTWFRHLPDRGWGLLRPLGLLLVGFAVWLLGSLGFLKLNAGSGLGGLLLLFGLGALVLQRWGGGWAALGAWLRERRWLVLTQEALFLFALAFWTWYRIHDGSGISHTEQPMDFALMNAILRGGEMQPNDPWLSGYAISYYYLGYLLMAQVTALSAVPSGVAYNLALATLAALASVGIFSLASNLVASDEREPRHPALPIAAGLLAVLLLLGISNLTGVATMLYHRGSGPDTLYQWLGVNEMMPDPATGERATASGWWWWKASRTIYDRGEDGGRIEVIDEFPFFSFLLGDMHPHVLALPFALLGLTLAMNALSGALASPTPRRWHLAQLPPEAWGVGDNFGKLTLLLSAVVVGALGMLNTWDLPTQGAILALVWLLAALFGAARGAWRPTLLGWASGGALLLLGALLLYLPFYIGFSSQADGIRLSLWSTAPQQYLLMFGLFWLVLLPLVLTQAGAAAAAARAVSKRTLAISLLMLAVDAAFLLTLSRLNLPEARLAFFVAAFWLLIPLTLLALLEGDDPSPLAIAQVAGLPLLVGLATQRWTMALTALLLGLTLLALWARVRALLPLTEQAEQPQPVPARPAIAGGSPEATLGEVALAEGTSPPGVPAALLFALILTAFALLLTMGSEMFYIKDGFPGRMNTIFKLYYQAWLLMATASAFGVVYLARRLPVALKVPWLLLFALVTLASTWYPLQALPSKAAFNQPANWDGRFWMANIDPDRFAAIEWLNALPEEQVVILEKPGGAYNASESALAGWTGHSTLLGWKNHEGQWRGDYDEIGIREPIIQQIYQTTSADEARALVEQWDIDYVAVTPQEIGAYSLTAPQLDKFRAFMTPVFEQGSVILYGR